VFSKAKTSVPHIGAGLNMPSCTPEIHRQNKVVNSQLGRNQQAVILWSPQAGSLKLGFGGRLLFLDGLDEVRLGALRRRTLSRSNWGRFLDLRP